MYFLIFYGSNILKLVFGFILNTTHYIDPHNNYTISFSPHCQCLSGEALTIIIIAIMIRIIIIMAGMAVV